MEKMIVVKEHERARYDFDPTMFHENRLWNRRPDGIVINKNHRTLYILEFKWSSDRNKDFLRVKTPPKWRKCESFRGHGLRSWRLERAMDRMDRPRTSIDERMLSGRCAVMIV